MTALLTLHQGNPQELWMLNSAYITLIPKKADEVHAGDFRPISLVHNFAKLTMKIMANQLAPSKSASLFKPECLHSLKVHPRFHDNFMLVQQTIKLLQCKKTSNLFLKLDISKPSDFSLEYAGGLRIFIF